MIYQCTTGCGLIWTARSTKTKVDPSRVPSQTCPDCKDFDWPNYTKRTEAAVKSLGKPKAVKEGKQ